ncbi:MAG: YbaN family protein [Halioglobus sp.]|nr:YbaN family protein [Halioglobus sp.]
MKTAFYKPLGLLFLLLGCAGLVLPVVPTTPFILLAAFCFARSSEAWHQRLLASELFGPIIANWEQRRCIARRTKLVAVGMMLFAGGASIAFAMEDYRLRLLTAALMLVGGTIVLRLKTCPECSEDTLP